MGDDMQCVHDKMMVNIKILHEMEAGGIESHLQIPRIRNLPGLFERWLYRHVNQEKKYSIVCIMKEKSTSNLNVGVLKLAQCVRLFVAAKFKNSVSIFFFSAL
uniref:Uncharacterized protein n=1 Tax=Cacopsylla melanoneura TaxID=428564 RepID=A0A8D9BE98_9HEMI